MSDSILSKILNKKRYALRRIRSFVCRRGRFTKGQQYAINAYWPFIGVSYQREYLNLVQLFGRSAPLTLEIGFGMGDSLVKMAAMQNQQNFIGIEVYLPGIGACLASAHNAGLSNLRVIYHDAVEVLENMIPDHSVSILQIFFPDPWPKVRHNKRRIVQPSFVQLVKSKLCIGGMFHIATDCQPYAQHILAVMTNEMNFHNTSLNGGFVSKPATRPLTKYEQRGQQLGHGVWDLIFEKIVLEH